MTFAPTTGLRASSGGSTQTTGPGKVLGLPDGYAQAFPGELRTLSGRGTGVLLAQQTAANLHAKPGDTIAIGRPGTSAAKVRVDGVVDLPAADSLFQKVGAPVGAQPQAPPDNVVLLPAATFQQVYGGVARARPELVRTQVHATLRHALPGSPSAAFTQVSGKARNLETQLAGGGLVGDNLGTALDQARKDALYAQLLFLFLGVPGAILAGLVTASIASAGADRRRRDAALLRTRGASTRQLVRVALAETALAGGAGVALGLGGALVIGQAAFGTASFGAEHARRGPLGRRRRARRARDRRGVDRAARVARRPRAHRRRPAPAGRPPRPRAVVGALRPGLRRARLSGLVYWQASRNGYNLVLAPEGVPQVSVNWYALLAPVLGWVGAGLLAYRIADLVLVARPHAAGARAAPAGRRARADRGGDDGPPAPAAGQAP